MFHNSNQEMGLDRFFSLSDKKGRTAEELEQFERFQRFEIFKMSWEETIGVQWMSRTELQLHNKLRRRTEQMLGRGRGIQREKGGCQRDLKILKWGKEKVKSDSTKGGSMDNDRIVLSYIIIMSFQNY